MKLEEVLPAMRAGRVAIGSDGFRYRIANGKAEMWSVTLGRWLTTSYFDATDGWTLEPEPKVEWPKGSYQWAAEQVPIAACFDKHMRRKSTGRYSFESAYDMLALDWEVVP